MLMLAIGISRRCGAVSMDRILFRILHAGMAPVAARSYGPGFRRSDSTPGANECFAAAYFNHANAPS